MKLTAWEVTRLLEALDHEIEAQLEEGRSAKGLLRLYKKVHAYASLIGVSP